MVFLIAVFLFAQIANVADAAEESSTGQTPLESFKAFIASPPNIESLVFKKITAYNHAVGLPSAEGDIGPKDAITYFHARWQPDALFLKSGTNLDVTLPGKQNGEEIDVKLGEAYWMLEPDGFVSSWRDRIQSPLDIRSSPSRAFHHRSVEFNQLVNMGLMHLGVGAVKWQGDAFDATGYVVELKVPVPVKGLLKATPDGHPKEMEVEYRIRDRAYHYVVRYDYRANVGLPFLPSRIRSCLVQQGKEITLMDWTILSIKTSPIHLAESLFDPQPIVAANRSQVLHYTNNAWYARNALGDLIPIRNLSGDAHASPQELTRNNLYYAAVAFGTLLAFASVWMARRENKQKKGTV